MFNYFVVPLFNRVWLDSSSVGSSNGLWVEAEDFLVFIMAFLMSASSCLVFCFLLRSCLVGVSILLNKSRAIVWGGGMTLALWVFLLVPGRLALLVSLSTEEKGLEIFSSDALCEKAPPAYFFPYLLASNIWARDRDDVLSSFFVVAFLSCLLDMAAGVSKNSSRTPFSLTLSMLCCYTLGLVSREELVSITLKISFLDGFFYSF